MRRRMRAGRMLSCSRYLATVRRAMFMPSPSKRLTIFWSERGFVFSSASMKRRIASRADFEETSGTPTGARARDAVTAQHEHGSFDPALASDKFLDPFGLPGLVALSAVDQPADRAHGISADATRAARHAALSNFLAISEDVSPLEVGCACIMNQATGG